MTKREAYIRHCESLGISRGLARLMADTKDCYLWRRYPSAALQVDGTLVWETSEQGWDFWHGVWVMLIEMAKTGECK